MCLHLDCIFIFSKEINEIVFAFFFEFLVFFYNIYKLF